MDPMETRVTRLEVNMDHVCNDMTEMKADLKTLVSALTTLPTKDDLWAWKWQWTALMFAAVAIIIGGIIGGLSWIKLDAPVAPVASAPIVITVPASPPVAKPS